MLFSLVFLSLCSISASRTTVASSSSAAPPVSTETSDRSLAFFCFLLLALCLYLFSCFRSVAIPLSCGLRPIRVGVCCCSATHAQSHYSTVKMGLLGLSNTLSLGSTSLCFLELFFPTPCTLIPPPAWFIVGGFTVGACVAVCCAHVQRARS